MRKELKKVIGFYQNLNGCRLGGKSILGFDKELKIAMNIEKGKNMKLTECEENFLKEFELLKEKVGNMKKMASKANYNLDSDFKEISTRLEAAKDYIERQIAMKYFREREKQS